LTVRGRLNKPICGVTTQLRLLLLIALHAWSAARATQHATPSIGCLDLNSLSTMAPSQDFELISFQSRRICSKRRRLYKIKQCAPVEEHPATGPRFLHSTRLPMPNHRASATRPIRAGLDRRQARASCLKEPLPQVKFTFLRTTGTVLRRIESLITCARLRVPCLKAGMPRVFSTVSPVAW
jgi:hypothetical protein